jgi:Uma2 family endonuclease
MTEPRTIRYLTVDEYLALEETSPIKHEYVRGQIFAMTGGTVAHNQICMNLATALHGFLKRSGCSVFSADIKVRVEAADAFYYPDVVVSCEQTTLDQVTLHSPIFICEISSRSTRQIDRREKLIAYRQLPSLQHYALIDQRKICVELYSKTAEGAWTLMSLGKADSLVLPSLAGKSFSLPIADIYDGLDLPSSVREDEGEYELA